MTLKFLIFLFPFPFPLIKDSVRGLKHVGGGGLEIHDLCPEECGLSVAYGS
jgi:hypothetical protein